MEKLDLRKELRHLYQPGAKAPVLVEVPLFRFLTIEGVGGVGGPEFQAAIGALYGLAYPLKFAAKFKRDLDYPVMPLEGLYWDAETGGPLALGQPERLAWRLLIMVPGAVPEELIETTRAEVAAKKDPPRLAEVELQALTEGKSVQIMHVGPYAAETATVERLLGFAEEQALEVAGHHHEIYISDPNRTAPEKLKTVVRYPVSPVG